MDTEGTRDRSVPGNLYNQAWALWELRGEHTVGDSQRVSWVHHQPPWSRCSHARYAESLLPITGSSSLEALETFVE